MPALNSVPSAAPSAALSGRRALVTGSSAGIGHAIAQALAAAGAEVVLNGRHRSALDTAVQRLRAAVPGARVHAVEADLAAAPGAHALVQAAGPVDLLINNLGIFEQCAFEAIDDAAWTRLFETNVMSGVRLSRALLPAMRARGFGRIVFVSSESGVSPPADMVHYGVTKAAQIALARGLAEACGDCGVTVNSVLPGPTLTEGAAAYFEAAAQRAGITVEQAHRDFFAHARPTSLIRRFIDPAEVAALVAHVCSPLGGAIHGAALRVEGGVVRSMI